MATLQQHKQIISELNSRVKGMPTFEQLQVYFAEAMYILEDCPEEKYAFEISGFVKRCCEKICQTSKSKKLVDAFWNLRLDILKWEAPHLLDSYMIYLEKDREPKERFYMPRRKHLMKHGLVQSLQDIEDDKYDILTISLPPGTGKTTFEKFFLSWVIGRHPEMYNLFYSHSDGITRMFYDGVLDITTNSDYRFTDIFPNVKLTKTDAKAQQITFNSYKPFPNLQTGTIDSNLAGKVRCNGYLLCDDLIGKMEQALNKVYLDKLWEVKYAGDAKQRKMTGCKEIHIATRWSVHDIIGRIMNLIGENPRAKFISVDCYDENGESNFDYDYGVGLTTEFLHEQEMFMDDISFKCLYRNQPIEREGQLYHQDDIRRYVSLPDGEPDAILGIADTKSEGTDYFFQPCMYQYGDDYYLEACICNNDADYGRQYDRMADMICSHNMQQLEIEANNGGSRVAFEVSERIKKRGARCNITTKFNTTNKETRIIVNADWVKKHVLFKDSSMYKPKDDYGVMMNFLFAYSVAGSKKQKDDVPDGLSNFALFVANKYRIKKSRIMSSPI